MIPKDENAEFVCATEEVAVYHRSYDPSHPVVCVDESP